MLLISSSSRNRFSLLSCWTIWKPWLSRVYCDSWPLMSVTSTSTLTVGRDCNWSVKGRLAE